MKRHQILLITLLFTFTVNVKGQNKNPHIEGTVEISLEQGTFNCDLTMENFPKVEDYFIRLNSGMNILNIADLSNEKYSLLKYEKSCSDSLSTGETNAYFFLDNNEKKKSLPDKICFKYVGKFPVVKDTLGDMMAYDWKGNIAFNGYSVRTDGMQSGWYPVLYDIKNDKPYYKVTYELKITCNDCNTLYINGNKPEETTEFNFKSSIPVEMALYCGNYHFAREGSVYFLNTDFSDKDMMNFENVIIGFQNYYADKLHIPYDLHNIVFINTTPVSHKQSWVYVSFPTFVSVGWSNNFKTIVEKSEQQNLYRAFLAHELAHYYFGTYKTFNSVLNYVFLEGFTEFVSLLLVRDLLGSGTYNKIIQRKINLLQNYNAVPISRIKSKNDFKNEALYAYMYFPLILLAIEKEIGTEKTKLWLSTVLTASTNKTDYKFLTSTLKSVLQDNNLLNEIERNYFTNEMSLRNAIDIIKFK